MAEKPVPSPAAPKYTARQLLRKIRLGGGRVYRMRIAGVFVLTSDEELALWLIKLGGKRYTPLNADPSTPAGSYKRAADGRLEWDIYVHTIKVRDEDPQAIWKAAAKDQQVENAEEAA